MVAVIHRGAGVNVSVIYHKIDEVDRLIELGELSIDDIVIISKYNKWWVVRFVSAIEGGYQDVRIELQRGGERFWSDPRKLVEYCVSHWKISHAKLQIEWGKELDEKAQED